MEYHQSRPGLKTLQQRIDDFIVAHEEKLEQVSPSSALSVNVMYGIYVGQTR